MKRFVKIISILTLIVFASPAVFAEDTYADINFPQWSKDLRRTEVITFGSLPFVAMWTSVGYGLAVQGSFHNPLDKSTSSYTEDDQKKIMAIAVGASIGLGLTDLAINLITRKYKKHKLNKIEQTIHVIPLSQQIEEMEKAVPQNEEQDKAQETLPADAETEEKDYLIKGLEDAVF